MCGSIKSLGSCSGVRAYLPTLVCTITAIALAACGVLSYYGHFGAFRTCSFLGGALVMSAIPFLIAAGYRFPKNRG